MKSKICKCVPGPEEHWSRGSYPQNEHDERVNMKMKSVSTSNGFFRVCLLCDKPTYLREGKGPRA